MLYSSRIIAASFSPLQYPQTTWSPWDPLSPLFIQQRLSLTTKPAPLTPCYLQHQPSPPPLVVSNTRTITKTSPQMIPRPLVTTLKSENGNSSVLEKSPAKIKLKLHRSAKSLIDCPSADEDFHNLADDYKYFSNSLNCLDATQSGRSSFTS